MEKLVYLFWDRPSRTPEDVRAQFVDDLAPRILKLGAHGLELDLDDEHAQVETMVKMPGDELPLRAVVSLWVDAHDFRARYEEVFADAGTRRAGYLVTESIYHERDRDWPDGTRSPGISTFTVFDKPAGMDDDTFYGHWYGHQSPMSEWMQPRVRYVRNTVVRPLTAGAPSYRALVSEAWPTVEHLTDLVKFFGVDSPDDLGENIRIMLDSTKLLFDPASMRNYTMSEYVIKDALKS
jgi:hypothetical protein